MKNRSILCNIFWMAALIAQGAFGAGELVPMTQLTTVTIPQGDTVWNPPLSSVYNLNPLQLRYNRSPNCPASPPAAVQVHFQSDPAWYATTPEQNGYFRHKGGAIDGLRVNFRQLQYPQLVCDMQIFGVAGDEPTPSGEEPRYVGVVTASGGYVHRKAVTWETAIPAQRFELKVPDFCSRIEIVEAGTVPSKERFVAAKSVHQGTDHLFRFNATMPLTNLVISLNGPKDLTCDIPVYVLTKP